VYYNIIITGLSVAVAFVIGTIEIVGLLSTEFDLHGAFWDTMANFNINRAGFIIVGMFVVTWVIALAIWRFGHIESRWDRSAALARSESATSLRMERGLEGVDPYEPAWAEAE
jgi:high-affinity nickel-transport protein